MPSIYRLDPKRDLRLTRLVAVPRALLWRAWTEPEMLKPWFCPLPWKVLDCEIDLRPGGIFQTTMQSPEGAEFPNAGCYLEVIPERRLVWTNALLPDWRPSANQDKTAADEAGFVFTAVVELEDEGAGTRYTATVIHADEAGCQKHAAMGFEAGWSAALDQLLAMVAQQGQDSAKAHAKA